MKWGLFLFLIACSSSKSGGHMGGSAQPHRRIIASSAHEGHPHEHLHPHPFGGHHHHPHPHPHLEGPGGHHHPY
jgi:hypothetical protein